MNDNRVRKSIIALDSLLYRPKTISIINSKTSNPSLTPFSALGYLRLATLIDVNHAMVMKTTELFYVYAVPICPYLPILGKWKVKL